MTYQTAYGKLFFVIEVDGTQREIYETHGDWSEAVNKIPYSAHPRTYISIVNNAYREDDGAWKYHDEKDTFKDIAQY